MSTHFELESPRRDHLLIATVLLLTGVGLVTLYSSSYVFSQSLFSRQAILGSFGVLVFFVASIFDLDLLRKLVKPALLVCTLLCILTFVPGIGIRRNGAARWIGQGSFSFQPSELVKLVLPLYLAYFYDARKGSIDSIRRGFIPPVLISITFVVLIILQNNFSTAVFLALNAFFLFFLAGVKLSYIFTVLIMFVPIAAFWVLDKEYRVLRFLSYIQPDFEPQGAGYQVASSIRSLSSGGFWGKGIGQGTRKLSIVPEVHSDFIFSSFAEEAGFLGVMLFCLLFTFFAVRGYIASMSNESTFNRLLGAGLVTMIVSQVLLNIAVVSGALPATGVPLPFFSAGGSSLVITLAMAGLIVNISRYSKKAV